MTLKGSWDEPSLIMAFASLYTDYTRRSSIVSKTAAVATHFLLVLTLFLRNANKLDIRKLLFKQGTHVGSLIHVQGSVDLVKYKKQIGIIRRDCQKERQCD